MLLSNKLSQQFQWELAAVLVFVVLIAAYMIPAIGYTRADVRDDLRKTDIAQLKQALERYNNTAKHYVPSPDGHLACTNSIDVNSWLFGPNSPLVKQKIVTAIPHDVRESATQNYQYCITDIQNNQVTAYYLQAQLENYQPDQIGFDEDEARKYAFRILNENGHTLYRVCGGSEKQCGTGSSS